MFKHDKINLFLFLVLIGLQVLGLVALWTHFRWTYLPIMFAVYFWAGISTTLYLHRYLTHRGFEMPGSQLGASRQQVRPRNHRRRQR